jgi:hypothetical protein
LAGELAPATRETERMPTPRRSARRLRNTNLQPIAEHPGNLVTLGSRHCFHANLEVAAADRRVRGKHAHDASSEVGSGGGLGDGSGDGSGVASRCS